MERESMEFDVVVVGAGVSGLSAAIKLMQLAQEQEKEISSVWLKKVPRSAHTPFQVP